MGRRRRGRFAGGRRRCIGRHRRRRFHHGLPFGLWLWFRLWFRLRFWIRFWLWRRRWGNEVGTLRLGGRRRWLRRRSRRRGRTAGGCRRHWEKLFTQVLGGDFVEGARRHLGSGNAKLLGLDQHSLAVEVQILGNFVNANGHSFVTTKFDRPAPVPWGAGQRGDLKETDSLENQTPARLPRLPGSALAAFHLQTGCFQNCGGGVTDLRCR